MLPTRIAHAMLGASCALSFAAHATLGQNASTVDSDQTHLRAVARAATTQSAYTVHLMTMPSGTLVREYVARNGIVFGVAWEGPTLPDLKSMLGASFDAYVAATATRRGTPLAVSNSDLVIFSGGHLRAFSGYAYLPQAVPAGVDVGVIQ
ncbi:DUF2844 domain-containing protein [Paraburkholderia ginsengisoli]|uniref:DUF2844 domain-containing protein n=1 Tax=Paraburkholderia ginsengisoli TaxID=311231 RepID=A0A7T4N9P1_9BURK|nr:DUF2844 domain-containing protein [Paraburkholderia ginsengisoli]QQC67813.1 DUF2844 domain-containing protein [Paraburkholderia ginsengisoli]